MEDLKRFMQSNHPTQDDELLNTINKHGGDQKNKLLEMLKELRSLSPEPSMPGTPVGPSRDPAGLKGGMFDRASNLTQQGLMGDDYMQELALMRRRAAEEKAKMIQQQESVLGPDRGAPSVNIEDDVIGYYRQLGIPDEMIMEGLGLSGDRRPQSVLQSEADRVQQYSAGRPSLPMEDQISQREGLRSTIANSREQQLRAQQEPILGREPLGNQGIEQGLREFLLNQGIAPEAVEQELIRLGIRR